MKNFFSILIKLSAFLILFLVGMFSSGCNSSNLGRISVHETTCVSFKDCLSKMSDNCYTKANMIKSTATTTVQYYCE